MHICPRSGRDAALGAVVPGSVVLPPALEFLADALEDASVAIYIRRVDPFHTIARANGKFSSLLGYSSARIVGHPVCCLFHDSLKDEMCPVVGGAEVGAALDEMESIYQTESGDAVYVRLNRNLYDEDGAPCKKSGKKPVWSLVFVHDMTAQKNHLVALESFVGIVSHEIRTPLNAVIGFTQMLLNGFYGLLPTDVKTALRHILESATLVLDFVQRELHCTRFGECALDETVIPVDNVIGLATHMLAPIAKDRGVHIEHVPCSGVHLSADHIVLYTMVSNLLKNAVLYSTNGGRVRVECRAVDGAVTIVVSDTGIGIRRENLDNIFKMHFRENHRVRGGMGLGLAIVKRFIGLHGGTVSVKSEAGVGSVFTLWFPKERTVFRNE